MAQRLVKDNAGGSGHVELEGFAGSQGVAKAMLFAFKRYSRDRQPFLAQRFNHR
jgi:hypothetical protein